MNSGRPAGPADWLLYRCRADIMAAEQAARLRDDPLPIWAKMFLARQRRSNLVEAAETVASEMLARAGAICEDAPPPVRLTRLAEALRVSLHFLAEETVKGLEAVAEGPDPASVPWLRGTIVPDGPKRWVLQAGSRNSRFTRQTVAHELGHALLFEDEGEIDLETWRATSWSAAEETIVNYIARLILMPDELLRRHAGADTNAASMLVTRLAPTFRVPHRLAAIRYLDMMGPERPAFRAFFMWRQYHPMSDHHIRRTFRAWPQVSTRLSEIARELRTMYEDWSFGRMLALWGQILDADRMEIAPTLELDAREDAMVDRLRQRIALPTDPTLRARITDFLDPWSWRFIRPEWVVWRGRPAGSYVPHGRGGAREGSLAARLAMQRGSAAEIATERVDIGDLVGDFRLHGYAHGDASEGSRFVLVGLEELS